MNELEALEKLELMCELAQKLCVAASGAEDDLDNLLKELKPQIRTVDDLNSKNLREINKKLTAILKTLPDKSENSNDGDSLLLTGSFLRSLLAHLTYPKELFERSENLKEELKSFIIPSEFKKILNNSLNLITKTFDFSNENFQNFLDNVNDNLAALENIITTAGEFDNENKSNTKELSNKVHEQITTMQSTIDDAKDLDTLKINVESKLKSLVTSIDDFTAKEEERLIKAEENAEKLRQKLLDTEQQTKDLLVFLEEEKKLSRHDQLTKLPNRAAYQDLMHEELEKAPQQRGKIVLAVADIDHFKKLNDSYGHLAGDKVLAQVAKVLRKGLHLDDFVCRYGGEEFVIVLADKDSAEAHKTLDYLRQSLAELPFHFGDKDNKIQVTMSIGATELQAKDDLDSVFQRADDALYAAKQERNKVVVT